MRIFYSSDVHGSEKCFLKFTHTWKVYKANILILAGDLTGKLIIPILKHTNGTFEAQYMDSRWVARTQEELEELEKKIRYTGYYLYLATPDEVKTLRGDEKKIDKLFLDTMVKSIRRWAEIIKERLKGTGVRCFINPGNDDHPIINSSLNEALEGCDYVVNPEEGVITLNGRSEMITLGYSNPTPWNSPREISEDELEKKIDSLATKVDNIKNCIFNIHVPPYGTHIDMAPKLNKTLKPVISGGQLVLTHVGSVAVRKSIEKYQPLLGLHGHVHESKGFVRIGRTLCLNPGSEYTEGILKGVIVDIDGGKVKSYVLTSG